MHASDLVPALMVAAFLVLCVAPGLAIYYSAQMNERLAKALEQVGDISRDNARLYRERHALIGERDETRIRLDEARNLARPEPGKEPG